ncbi:MAG: hypothetical protein MHM6MM_003425 [Cercozoa sp. M6MM]
MEETPRRESCANSVAKTPVMSAERPTSAPPKNLAQSTESSADNQSVDRLRGFYPAKEFNDPVHGQITLPAACVKVIDTPEFQRLRHLKQLGASCYAYPSATHTRFEHSLGVAHLAWKLVKELKKNQPNLKIEPNQELCVVLAALCHDIGHGPFSHSFDSKLLPRFKKRNNDGEPFKHEHASVKLIDNVFKVRSDPSYLQQLGLEQSDLDVIKAMIDGEPPADVNPDDRFLYDIVSNKESGLDVDKLDYFIRDSYHTGVPAVVDFERLLKTARVHRCPDKKNNPLRIAFPEKAFEQVFQVFATRFYLHRTIYNHAASTAVELMICDALVAANDNLKRYVGGESYTLASSVDNMAAYVQFTDSVFEEIQRLPETHKARKIVDRILARDLYKLVGHLVVLNEAAFAMEEEAITEAILAAAATANPIDKTDLAVERLTMHHGKKSANPVDSVLFFSKDIADDEEKAAYHVDCSSYSAVRPNKFQECRIRVFVKQPQKLDAVKFAFKSWAKKIRTEGVVIDASQPASEMADDDSPRPRRLDFTDD